MSAFLNTHRRLAVRRRVIALGVVLAVVVPVVAGCAGRGTEPSSSGSVSTPGATPTPAVASTSARAWDAAEATITLGAGEHRIDVWFDAMCPFCARFDDAQSGALERWSASGESRVVLHPLTFLDRASEGTEYSTRAASVLAEAARTRPDAVLPILADLMREQPAEDTSGLSDARLAAIGRAHDVDVRHALRHRPFDRTLGTATSAALTGSTPIAGTPTVRFDGETVTGDLYGEQFVTAIDAALAQ